MKIGKVAFGTTILCTYFKWFSFFILYMILYGLPLSTFRSGFEAFVSCIQVEGIATLAATALLGRGFRNGNSNFAGLEEKELEFYLASATLKELFAGSHAHGRFFGSSGWLFLQVDFLIFWFLYLLLQQVVWFLQFLLVPPLSCLVVPVNFPSNLVNAEHGIQIESCGRHARQSIQRR